MTQGKKDAGTMKTDNQCKMNQIKIRIAGALFAVMAGSFLLWGCKAVPDRVSGDTDSASGDGEETAGDGALESAADGTVDFAALQEQNPDIFAWLYVPGTDIDAPVLQSHITDDYYKTHTADGKEGSMGALYTEMANLMNLCDFNTIIHGKDRGEGDLFYDLHQFENPDYFREHSRFYIYLPGNVLTYEIVMAYYDEGSDILRRYDYTTYEGCESLIRQMQETRDMNKCVREGWEELTPYHYLVTLNGSVKEEEQTQYVVIGVLTGDAAGTISRVILE